jgi:lipoprotein NlpD
VGGAAIALVVVLLGVFLLPGMLMGGGPGATATPGATALTAGVTLTEAPPAATSVPEQTERPEKTPKPKIYTVKPGDTLIKIAKRFNVSVAKLTCLNRIRNPNNVAVGRSLTIPPKGYRCPRD